ncbi:hypothetical protein HOE37_03945 [Candidatus Woesearchaeota archaeon]|nr:hypothetical protein [Candidatus Woesearchaeota archaeon]MBT4110984.1 hypothetical protein [Candidatus Woesearchaeota archaeon]MBT4336853.1 hypothetical protein [Candidatus Woesearchaeota archaeon]MBT4469832.1 hypothetical protein [Candidatus Woesearchaeota archaeon]MBT6743697.1 hypothetical protein [Candidatus Woesearchaeota archaeon]
MEKKEIEKHKTLMGFISALREDRPVAIYDGGSVCSCDLGDEMAVALIGLVQKSKTKLVGASGCEGFESYARQSGKIVVDVHSSSIDGIIDDLTRGEQYGTLSRSLGTIFSLGGDYTDPCRIGGREIYSVLTGIPIVERVVQDQYLGLAAIESALIDGRIKAFSDLSWYSHGKPKGKDDEGSMSLMHQPVTGAFYVSPRGTVIGHARADLKMPFSDGEMVEELKKFAAEHDFYLSKRSVYHGKSGEATFAIRGEIDPEWGRPWADARRVPDTVYARSETSGYSLHASQAATEQLAEVWLPRIRAAMDCKERHRKTITEIFEE